MMITTIINSINMLFSHATNPLSLIIALIVVVIIGGLGLILAIMLVSLPTLLWFVPICHLYDKLNN